MASATTTTVVLYPSPGIGHLVAMVELGKRIINTQCLDHRPPSLSQVIILLTPPNQTTTTTTAGSTTTDEYINTVVVTTPSIKFHNLPAISLPPDFYSAHIDVAFGIPNLYKPILHNTLVAISHTSTIKAVILDFFSNAAFQVSTSLHLPTYYFYTGGASGLCVFLHLPTIHNTTPKSIKHLNNTYFNVPGVPPIHSSDIPMHLVDKKSNSYINFIETSNNMARSSGIIVNSFRGFEQRAVDTLRYGKCIPDGPTPPIYLVGPLIATGKNRVDSSDCLKWLNSQPSKSVVFLCFGSMGVFNNQQLKEIAIGLQRSRQRFLWVVRNPSPDHESNHSGFDLNDILPEGFLTRTVDKGLVVKNWAPQPAILSHESVGGFLSHCGWNSTLEAVVAGVPMVAWPLYAEQTMNRVYLVKEMKVALAVKMSADGFVTAEEVEEKVRELMQGTEEGRVVRERVLEMSRKAKAAVDDGGSSRIEFSKLLQSWTSD